MGQEYDISQSFRFRKSDIERLEWIAKRWGISKASVLRLLLGKAVREEGMSEADEDKMPSLGATP